MQQQEQSVGILMLELSLYVVVFISLSGLMAMVEAAVLSVSLIEVEEMRIQGAMRRLPEMQRELRAVKKKVGL